MILPVLLIVTASFRPAHPTVGDLITVSFAKPVTIDGSSAYEIVSQQGSRVVVRSFLPQPIALSGLAGTERFDKLVIPIGSVLKPKDDLAPAPLVPPRKPAMPRLPFILIGAATAVVLALWTAVILLARRARRMQMGAPAIPPEEVFRSAVDALRRSPEHAQRWAGLADATRTFLAASRGDLGEELTTVEILRRFDSAPLAEILRQGDLEKFSPWGPAPDDFATVCDRALTLIPEPVPEPLSSGEVAA